MGKVIKRRKICIHKPKQHNLQKQKIKYAYRKANKTIKRRERVTAA